MKKYIFWSIPCLLLSILIFTSCEKSQLNGVHDDTITTYKNASESHSAELMGEAMIYSDLSGGTVADILSVASTYTPNISNYKVEFADGRDTTISLTSVMLSFKDTTDFLEALEISSYFSLDTLNQMISSFASYSNSYLRFEFDASNNGIQDIGSYLREMTDRKFARLYNEANAVRIGDTIYVEFFQKDAILLYDLKGGNHNVISYKSTSSFCPNQNRPPIYVSGWYDATGRPSGPYSHYILASYKFNETSFWEARIEFGFKLFRYIPGTVPFIPEPLNNFGIWLDIWNQCCYKKPSESAYNCKSDLSRSPVNPPYYNPFIIVANRYSVWPKSYCVSEFGRIHNWVWNFNEDVHHEIW